MKAVSRIQATVDGMKFDIPAGREVPPELAEFLATNGGASLMIADEPKHESKKGK